MGRHRKYDTNAERQAAYRERKALNLDVKQYDALRKQRDALQKQLDSEDVFERRAAPGLDPLQALIQAGR